MPCWLRASMPSRRSESPTGLPPSDIPQPKPAIYSAGNARVVVLALAAYPRER
jgi:hypothetical protein